MRDLFDPIRFPGIEDELCFGIFELTINLLQFSLFFIFHIGNFITLVRDVFTSLYDLRILFDEIKLLLGWR